MGIPRRFTLHRLVAATTLLGLLLGGAIELTRWPRRAGERRSIASYHTGISKHFGGRPESVLYWTTRWRDQMPAGFPVEDYLKEFLAYHDRMRTKWERAASRPWAMVEPDPPQPNLLEYWHTHGPR